MAAKPGRIDFIFYRPQPRAGSATGPLSRSLSFGVKTSPWCFAGSFRVRVPSVPHCMPIAERIFVVFYSRLYLAQGLVWSNAAVLDDTPHERMIIEYTQCRTWYHRHVHVRTFIQLKRSNVARPPVCLQAHSHKYLLYLAVHRGSCLS